ncbi:hypothetical protein Poli38472_002125 [Pythium oligandrum]|uniref:Uncharacterized protein n=1 Tax=Pythium oligandrum TaxID=41045 RepID=A0A8K1CHK3_PYTOL|nr:hypothetical protein Poli38472_002125 [Pythium oligandrum]|eukprot:TMW63184.1 hypothetical protein Poli38472_002125 [Pythium oligandrum]
MRGRMASLRLSVKDVPASIRMSPRVARHLKAREDAQDPKAHHFQGRRLIQMLFRSNNADDARGERTEGSWDSSSIVTTATSSLPPDSRHEEDPSASSTESGSKFRNLKRKLFPSRQRRHPVRIPPLLISPIATGSPAPGSNQTLDTSIDSQHEHADVVAVEHPASNDDSGGSMSDEDDLVMAIEAADLLQPSTNEEALAEMNRAIGDLYAWKHQHEEATQFAMREMEKQMIETKNQLASSPTLTEVDTIVDTIQHLQQLSLMAREKLSLAMMKTEGSFATHRDDERVARVIEEAQRQAGSEDDVVSIPRGLSKLREEVFDLGVKNLSSQIQASWLNDLESAETALDLKLADVEAFASELDQVLAQFELVSIENDEASELQPSQDTRES